MWKKIKPIISVICAALLVGAVITSSYRACRLYNENSILKGRDIEISKQLEVSLSELRQLTSDNAFLLTELEKSKKEAADAADRYNSAASDIQDTFRTVGELRANAKNDKALIVELEIELNKRDEAINKLILAYAEKEKEISYMQKQYTALAVELKKTKSVLDESIKLNVLRAERIKELEGSLSTARLGGKLKTGVAIGLAAVVVYGLLK